MVSWQTRADAAPIPSRRSHWMRAVVRQHHRQRQDRGRARPPRFVQRWSSVEHIRVDGHDCYTLTPTGGPPTGLHLFHVHSGGPTDRPARGHWRLAHQMVQRLGCSYTLTTNPSGPPGDHSMLVATVAETYEHTMTHTQPHHRVVIGDAASGPLVLDLATDLRARARPQPAAIALLWPSCTAGVDMAHGQGDGADPAPLLVIDGKAPRRWIGRSPHHGRRLADELADYVTIHTH